MTMDGITSPIKADPEWAKLRSMASQRCVKLILDTFMESSWYYALTRPDYDKGMLDPKATIGYLLTGILWY